MKNVEIKITKGKYAPSVKNGAEYTSVGYDIPSPYNEGAGSPCDTEEDVKHAIEQASKRIRACGFNPIIVRNGKSEPEIVKPSVPEKEIEMDETNEKLINELFKTAGPRSGDEKEIIGEITKFSPHTETLTLSTLIAINQRINVINVSHPGLGKSRVTTELLDSLKIPYELVAGRITAKQFFKKLEQIANQGYMVIDESATLLTDTTIKELLLSALWGGCVSWETERETLSIKFKGTIIFNTNKIGNDAFTMALKDRVIFNSLVLNKEQVKDKIMSKKTYEFNEKIWNTIKNNTFNQLELTNADEELIWKFIEATSVKSVRDEWRIRKIGKGLKNILGSLNYLKEFCKVDVMSDTLMDNDLSRADKVKKISEFKKITDRGARKIVKNYEQGKIL
jgi:hypothetical protein